MKILVTGASGLLGSEITNYLNRAGHKIIGIFNRHNRLAGSGIKKIKCDIGNLSSINSLPSKIDLIIHCAAMTNVNECEKDKKKCFQANVIGTRNIISLAKKSKAKLIYISTPSVFDGITGNYQENDPPNPKNYYSSCKLLGEESALSYNKSLIIRTAPIGIHSLKRPPTNFFEWLMDSIKNNIDIDLYNDVNFNPLSTATLAKIILDINKKASAGLIHIGSRNFLSKASVGKLVLAKFPNYKGAANIISVAATPNLTERPKEMWLNINRALGLGINLPTLEQEINSLII